MKEKVEDYKIKNIIEMAVSFTAMGRVFEKGSLKKIKEKLYSCIEEFLNLSTKEEHHKKHKGFCKWFTTNIKTAERKKDGKIIKTSQPASYGHATKIIDIVLKVCVYYCNLSSNSSIVEWLNGAIDNPILKDIKKHHKPQIISQVSTIGGINKKGYEELQKIICEESKKEGLFPVQYEDIKWRDLNRRNSDKKIK